MRVARLVLTFLAAGGSTWAQRQYIISTVAGGEPALTPGPAASATLKGLPKGHQHHHHGGGSNESHNTQDVLATLLGNQQAASGTNTWTNS